MIDADPKYTDATAAQMLAGAQGGFALGRFVGTFIMKFVRPRWVFIVYLAMCIVFVAPSIISAEMQREYDVKTLGRVGNIRERFYAISLDRKLKHPAVVAISEAARVRLSD